MSNLWFVMILKEESNPSLNEYMLEYGGTEVALSTTSRDPTIFEICQVLSEMPKYTKVYSASHATWFMGIYETIFYDQGLPSNGLYTDMWGDFVADESSPVSFSFQGGRYEVNLEIALRLTRFTGPLLTLGSGYSVPLVVYPSDTLANVISQWEKLCDIEDRSYNAARQNKTIQSR